MTEDEGIPEERPWRKREYSGATSTMGIAILAVLTIGAGIWFLEFRGTGSNGGPREAGLGIVALPANLNVTGRPAAAEIGRAAPDFRLRTLDGETANLSDFRGETVLVNFWASWCGPCRGEAPELESLHGTGVTVLGVNQLEDRRAAAKFQQEFALTYPLVLDASGEVSQAYRANGLPVSFLIDEDGVVLHIFRGAVKKADIDAALAEVNP